MSQIAYMSGERILYWSGLIPALMLLLAACIWGFAFVAQSVGAQYVGPFTFLTIRCWIAVAFLTPVVAVNDSIRERKGLPKGKAVTVIAEGDDEAAAVEAVETLLAG